MGVASPFFLEVTMQLTTTNTNLIYNNDALPSLIDAWSDPERVGKPAVMTYGELGVKDLPAEGTCIAYLDVEGHPALAAADPRAGFDDVDLDRLFAFATFREWSRHHCDPRRGILLMGPSGTGKTVFLETRFAQRGIPMYSVTGSPDAILADWIMTKEVVNGTTYWEPGPLLQAMTEGVPFVIQEIDLLNPAQLTSINEIVDKGICLRCDDKSVVRAKRGFMVFGTCNSSFTEDRSGAFRGTRGQNQSVLNRFYKYTVTHATPDQEVEVIQRIHPEIALPLATRMAHLAELTRAAAADEGAQGGKLSVPLSRRHLLDWADILKGMAYLRNSGKNIDLATYTLEFVYTGNLPAEERATIDHLFKLAFTAADTDS